jgi:hypothetical protein
MTEAMVKITTADFIVLTFFIGINKYFYLSFTYCVKFKREKNPTRQINEVDVTVGLSVLIVRFNAIQKVKIADAGFGKIYQASRNL